MRYDTVASTASRYGIAAVDAEKLSLDDVLQLPSVFGPRLFRVSLMVAPKGDGPRVGLDELTTVPASFVLNPGSPLLATRPIAPFSNQAGAYAPSHDYWRTKRQDSTDAPADPGTRHIRSCHPQYAARGNFQECDQLAAARSDNPKTKEALVKPVHVPHQMDTTATAMAFVREQLTPAERAAYFGFLAELAFQYDGVVTEFYRVADHLFLRIHLDGLDPFATVKASVDVLRTLSSDPLKFFVYASKPPAGWRSLKASRIPQEQPFHFMTHDARVNLRPEVLEAYNAAGLTADEANAFKDFCLALTAAGISADVTQFSKRGTRALFVGFRLSQPQVWALTTRVFSEAYTKVQDKHNVAVVWTRERLPE